MKILPGPMKAGYQIFSPFLKPVLDTKNITTIKMHQENIYHFSKFMGGCKIQFSNSQIY
jgi:hypothetical protein